MSYTVQGHCDGKVKLLSRGLAEDVARKSSRSHEVKMSPYLCIYCGKWHVGRANKRKPQLKQPRRYIEEND